MNTIDLNALLTALEAAFKAFEKNEPNADVLRLQAEARVIAKRVRSQIDSLGRQP